VPKHVEVDISNKWCIIQRVLDDTLILKTCPVLTA